MRVVLDTSVLVAGTRSASGASRQLIVGAREGLVVPLVAVPLVLEYEDVLLRPTHLAAAGASVAEMLALIDDLVAIAEAVDRHYLARPLLADPADHHVAETAINGRADLLITLNTRDLAPSAASYQFRVLTPGEALRAIRRLGVQ